MARAATTRAVTRRRLGGRNARRRPTSTARRPAGGLINEKRLGRRRSTSCVTAGRTNLLPGYERARCMREEGRRAPMGGPTNPYVQAAQEANYSPRLARQG